MIAWNFCIFSPYFYPNLGRWSNLTFAYFANGLLPTKWYTHMSIQYRLWISCMEERWTGRPYKHVVSSRWWFQKFFIFTPNLGGRWTHFDDHIFQTGWFNHQLDYMHRFFGVRISGPNSNFTWTPVYLKVLGLDSLENQRWVWANYLGGEKYEHQNGGKHSNIVLLQQQKRIKKAAKLICTAKKDSHVSRNAGFVEILL